MSTNEIVQRYFEELKQRGRWESFLADDMTFTSFTSPVKEVSGKAAYLESTKRFFSMVKSVEVRDLIIDGAKACALTRYQLQAPSGSRFQSDVAELFTVRNGKIATSFILTPHRSRSSHRYGTARGPDRKSESSAGAHAGGYGKENVRWHHLHGKREDVYQRWSPPLDVSYRP